VGDVDNRVFGLRNQYRVGFSGGAQRQVPAAERILEGLLVDAGQQLRAAGTAGDISVFKSNAGGCA